MVIKDIDNTKKYIKKLKSLNNSKILIGITGTFDSNLLMIASVNEFGINITVTPKMRAFLHYKGLHLSPGTNEIKIPERSFIRDGFDDNIAKITKIIENKLDSFLFGKINKSVFLNFIGLQLSSILQKHLTDLKSPGNHPFTVEEKGSSNPLIDSGRLRQAISYEVY